MHRFMLSQLRFRRGRIAALALGILVAAVSFTVLTSAADTSELRVKGTVTRNFRTAYDILVRPPDSFTELERERSLVRANYLGGIYGGITHEQYRQIRNIHGVDVAAPIANIGYIMAFRANLVALNRHLSDAPAQMYRVKFTWRAHNDTSRYQDSDQYVYYTRVNRMMVPNNHSHPVEIVNGQTVKVCDGFWHERPIGSKPFSLAQGEGLMCYSEKSPGLKHFRTPSRGLPRRWVGTYSQAYFPILIAAIDPVQEQRLVGLADTIVDGRMLRPREGSRLAKKGPDFFWRAVPLIASTKTYVDANVRFDIERLDVPEPAALRRALVSEENGYDFVKNLEGEVVATGRSDAAELYEAWLDSITAPKFNIPYTGYWTTSSVDYRPDADDRLIPQIVRNPYSVFRIEGGGGWAPLENRDVQFRALSTFLDTHASIENERGTEVATPAFTVVGRFDPERLAGFSELASVPLETYYPPTLPPADDATAEVLDGQPLLPTQNLGDYIAQPPLILTTLESLDLFRDDRRFKGSDSDAPISVVRVRVAGVTGPDAESRERIRRVAQTIRDRTGLAIDVTAGSSPQTLRVHLAAGKFGRPPLALEEDWVTKGVAVAFLTAIDQKSVALFGLILLICVFFLANGVLASVRTRRAEMGTLVCLGWSRRKMFSAIVGEVILIGFVAGLIGTVLAVVMVHVWSLEMSLLRALVVMPVAIGLAGTAAVIPAWRAARSSPLDAVRPAVSEDTRAARTRHVIALAIVNLRRVPARTALGAAGLFISVAAFTLLLAINHAFQGVLVGTVMGRFISLQVREVDVLTIVLTIILGGLAVADVLYLNVRERAAEFVTLRTTGWRNSDVRKLVALEGLLMGAFGSVGGAGLAAAVSLVIEGVPLASIALAAFLAAVSGVVAAALASLLPLSQIGRLTPPSVLAEEW